ncbi:MAG: HupE/UreJ family protein [Planctomycetota bacterium]|nr:HupE/UreJ family protein [Planctomycetota bacterium]
MILTILIALTAAQPHPMSVSSSRVVVDGGRVDVDLRCQAQTLVECTAVDADGDRGVSADELDSSQGVLESYLLAGYRLKADLGQEHGGERWLEGRLERAWIDHGAASVWTPEETLVEFVLRFEAPVPLKGLTVDLNLFREGDPLHRDHAEIVWNGAAPEARVLWVEDPTWTFTPSEETRSVLGSYVVLGFEHILTGYDHIAFLVALVVASRRLKSILAVVTAFTLAHSITLALASLGYVRVPSSIVEPAIAASIAYVAFRNVFGARTRTLWPAAFGFGLVHGLGFAGSIAETLADEPQKLAALFGFNAGVEVGQLALVTLLCGVLSLRSAKVPGENEDTRTLAPRWVRVSSSSIVGVLGIYWFVTRVFGA